MTAVAVYHNIVWPKYKGAVFSALHEQDLRAGPGIGFVQIAETDGERSALSGVDLRYHRYPYALLFKGGYDAVPTWRLCWTLARHVWRNPVRGVVLPGYHRPEYWAMLAVCRMRGLPCAVFCDSTQYESTPGSWAYALKALLKRAFLRRCAVYFAYGQRSAQYLLANGARAAGIRQPCQAAALPLGFDAQAALARRVAARSAAPWARFLYVGRLAAEKDLPTLLLAFQDYRRSRGAGQLVLVGEGPERSALQARVHELGLSDAVEFTGAMDIQGLADQYARALCLVLPSLREPWGLVVNEALHHGCPAIVSEHCGCRPELVADGLTGYAFATGDAQALTLCLQRAADELADAAAVGAACQRHMAAYTPERAASQILAGCQQLLAGQG